MGILAPDPGAHSTLRYWKDLNSGSVLKHWGRTRPHLLAQGRHRLWGCQAGQCWLVSFRAYSRASENHGIQTTQSRAKKQAQKLTTLKASGDPEAGPTPRPSPSFCLSLPTSRPPNPLPRLCVSPHFLCFSTCPFSQHRPLSTFIPICPCLCVSVSVSLPSLEVPEAWSNSPSTARSGPTVPGAGAADGCGCPPCVPGQGWEGREQVRMRHVGPLRRRTPS